MQEQHTVRSAGHSLCCCTHLTPCMLTAAAPAASIPAWCSKSEQINSDPNSALGSLPYTAPEVLSNTMKHGHQVCLGLGGLLWVAGWRCLWW